MTAQSYFDRLYATSGDPWGLAERPYEARKYALTVASLPRKSYARAFEPGCSIGVLTAALANRCATLLAMDGSAVAVEQASTRTADRPDVTVRQGLVPDDWPLAGFDLVVLSELLYYLDETAREQVARRAAASTEPGGHVIAVHWRHPFEEASTDGDVVHAELAVRLADDFRTIVRHVEPDFLLEVYERV